jgi:parallel beta-helix repeat protein
MSFPLINPTPTFTDSSGSPLASGTIEFRDPTSNDLINSYPTADDSDAQTNANANPLTLNSRGEAASGLYLEDGVKYKITLKDSAGATVWTQDDVRCPTHLPGDVRHYGAVCDGATDDSTAIDAALAVGGKVFIPAGKTCKASQLTMGVAGTELVIEAGATLSQITATNKLITVSGANCTITGPGKLLSPATFDGTNAQRTYGVVWVTGDNFMAQGLTLDTIPRSGIHFEAATNGRISHCKFIGNFPYADYTGTNTAHIAIDYDPPTNVDATDKVSVVVTGCSIETCVQGFLLANHGSAALETGITITGNTFTQCWDHGVYFTIGEGSVITGNTFVSCKVPIVADGVAASVCGNSLYSTELTQSNQNQSISVRGAIGAVISGNTLYGPGASILCDVVVTPTTIRDNIISDNTIISTGSGDATAAIRLGNTAVVCQNNLIENNVIRGVSDSFGEFVGAIQLEMASGSFGTTNIVRGNTITLAGKSNGINILDHNDCIVEDNTITSSATAAGAETHEMMLLTTSDRNLISNNNFVWTAGGTNITARGVHLGTGADNNRVSDNRFNLTAAGLTASDEIVITGSGTQQQRNQFDPTVAMNGTFTWTTTTSEFQVTNANVTTLSRIVINPVDSDAGVVVKTQGFYVEVAAGSFTIKTGDGTNTVAASDWSYVID